MTGLEPRLDPIGSALVGTVAAIFAVFAVSALGRWVRSITAWWCVLPIVAIAGNWGWGSLGLGGRGGNDGRGGGGESEERQLHIDGELYWIR